jgi:heavy metal sensor kinase
VKVRSLRFKLGWNHGLVISLVFLILGMARYKTVSYRSLRSFDQDLQNDVELFSTQFMRTSVGLQWSSDNLGIAEALTVEGFGPYFVVTDADGRVVAPVQVGRYMQEMVAGKILAPILAQKSGFGQSVAPDGTEFRFYSVPLPSQPGSPLLILHAGRPLDVLQGVLREYLFIFVTSVPIILLVSVGVGWILAGRALRPFEEVAQTAKHITSENLNTRIESSRTEEEVQSLIESFNAMVGRLNHSFQQMRKFNADVAHELRTPLAIMQGENEVALRSGSVPEEARAVLASNLEELERLTRIVNDLLTLSEAEAGNQVILLKPISLKSLVEDLVEQMQILATERHISIQLGAIPEAVIQGDELWIRRALLNLIDNAIKYSRDGGSIEVGAETRDGRVRLQIRDSGIGIAEADIPYIFDRLYRADPARSRTNGGTGLGLALVKWVVDAHEGEIRVTSTPERGSSFELAFPLV